MQVSAKQVVQEPEEEEEEEERPALRGLFSFGSKKVNVLWGGGGLCYNGNFHHLTVLSTPVYACVYKQP
jgi:hypothetical protein